MKVELLYLDGCPSSERFLPGLRELVQLAGVGAELELRRIDSVDAAVRERFLGSPTVRVDGRDVDPTSGGREDFGQECRLYWQRRGPIAAATRRMAPRRVGLAR